MLQKINQKRLDRFLTLVSENQVIYPVDTTFLCQKIVINI